MAFGSSTFSDIGGAVADLYGAKASRAKAQYDIIEQQQYGLAGQFAEQNVQITQMSTAIKEAQEQRAILGSLGQTRAAVAGAGFAASGSALDILRSSAMQGSLTKAVMSEQGLVTEAGYHEQAQSYQLMARAAGQAAEAEKQTAEGQDIAAGIKFGAAAFSLIPGGDVLSNMFGPKTSPEGLY
jgi:hypothetical protein